MLPFSHRYQNCIGQWISFTIQRSRLYSILIQLLITQGIFRPRGTTNVPTTNNRRQDKQIINARKSPTAIFCYIGIPNSKTNILCKTSLAFLGLISLQLAGVVLYDLDGLMPSLVACSTNYNPLQLPQQRCFHRRYLTHIQELSCFTETT